MRLTSRYSANVISAKARALYGKSLSEKNYSDLLACHSVSEVAAYLKNETRYGSVLTQVNEATIHRGYLETLLRHKLLEDYASLMRYDLSVGQHLSDYMIRREEIQQIVLCLRLMNAGRGDEFVLSMPSFFVGHTKLDMFRISRVTSYGELLDALVGTPYHKLLLPFAPKEGEHVSLTPIETALYKRLTETLFDVIDRTSGELRRQMIDLCGAQIDAQNVTRILRLKTFFHADADTIRANLLPNGRCIPARVIEQMVTAPNAEDVLHLFYGTRLGKRVPEEQRAFSYNLPHRVPYFSARHYMHFSTYPMVALFSYMMIMDTELDDIINIIEGIRYGMPPEEIRTMLILYGSERK